MHQLSLNQFSPVPFLHQLQARWREAARKEQEAACSSLPRGGAARQTYNREKGWQLALGPRSLLALQIKSISSQGKGYCLGICSSTSVPLPGLLLRSLRFQSSSLLCALNANQRSRGPPWWLGRPRERHGGAAYRDGQKLSQATSGLSTLHQQEARLK